MTELALSNQVVIPAPKPGRQRSRVLAGLAALLSVIGIIVSGSPAVVSAAVAGANSRTTLPSTAEGVPTCLFGAYVTSVYDVSPMDNTFSARVWVWSLCPARELDPLPKLTFPNSYGPEFSNDRESFAAGDYRHAELLNGKFRQTIDENSYPFDKQKLQILIDPTPNFDKLRLAADTEDSLAAPDIDVPGWSVSGFRVASSVANIPGNLGDRTIPPSAGHQKSRITVETDIVRADKVNFLKIIAPLIIIFMLTCGLLLVTTRSEAWLMELRVGGLAALIFATLLNMNRADDLIRSEGVTLLDQLHILTLLFIILAAVETWVALTWMVRELPQKRVTSLEVRSAVLGSLVYIALSTALVLLAVAGA